MKMRVFIANRGEIAVRIIRTCRSIGYQTVVVCSRDDANCLHGRLADVVVVLDQVGAAAFLNQEALIQVALDNQCNLLHPGYGFLSENAEFASKVGDAGLIFVGPGKDTLKLLGDKKRSRFLASEFGIPVLPGISSNVTEGNVFIFLNEMQQKGFSSIIVKATNGGGGKGMRRIQNAENIKESLEACLSESRDLYNSEDLIAEAYLDRAKHVEVQIVRDHLENVVTLGERECSIQRQHQKVVEWTPCPSLSPATRQCLLDASVALAHGSKLVGVCTFEYLVHGDQWYFMEANPRLQVEHTVTEEVWRVDLVETQLSIALGGTIDCNVSPKGYAIQIRINSTTAGKITRLDVPTGIRVETSCYVGFETNPRFDSLLCKLIVWGDTWERAVGNTVTAIDSFHISGVQCNVDFARQVLSHPVFLENKLVDTHFLSESTSFLTKVDGFKAPMQGEVTSVFVKKGDSVASGQKLITLNAFKMEHAVLALYAGIVELVHVRAGQVVNEGDLLLQVQESADGSSEIFDVPMIDLNTYTRDDLEHVKERHALLLDTARKDVIQKKRHALGRLSARECLDVLIDHDTFLEYGGLAIAQQQHRRTIDDLIVNTPADGVIGGFGSVDGTSCMVFSYDYMVLAGTQGVRGHFKLDRLFELGKLLPCICLTEGGGGRPGDLADFSSGGLAVPAFHLWANVSNVKIGIAQGYNFAGNAMLLGMCDVIIATRGSFIGLGGPAMIEGAGLGKVHATMIGPSEEHFSRGSVHMLAIDDEDAMKQAKRVLGIFQTNVLEYTFVDQRLLRTIFPEIRVQPYDMLHLIRSLADCDSVIDWSAGFGKGMICAFCRVEGRPLGVIGNQPMHGGGVIGRDEAEKATQFLSLCNRFRISVLSLCDTPGFIVGPEYEKTGTVKWCSAFFNMASTMKVPLFSIVCRKSYGLGAMAMCFGSQKIPMFVVSFPTGEFGGMGMEGAVRLGFRKELEAIEDVVEREEMYGSLLAAAYSKGSAMNLAQGFEIDDAIDPAQSRFWISRSMQISKL